MAAPDDFSDRTARTAELVTRLHEIVAELEVLHNGRKFTPDGHLVGSIAEALFDITLQPPSTAGHDAVAGDGRAVEIKGTYGRAAVAIRMTSHAAAEALIVLALSRDPAVPHEVVYNGPLRTVAGAIGRPGSNGQARLSLNRLRTMNGTVPSGERIPHRRRNIDADE
ncbi:hypothetical protein IRT45_26875 [Nocardia sp. BSTN01]|uniref:DUF6998 domain-containing protein n=1 Tax=Nocardia sp. BSTN01 TaxID=2783665 RepID=UPI00188EB7E4|nr:hypothetical protein [Nocardia sp. BSTN01]MBF5000768.1 hypothetical protein [Nocardia sp. BSTN01]